MPPDRLDLDALNAAPEAQAAALILPFIERAPDLAIAVAAQRPFERAEDLADAIRAAILALDEAGQLALFRGHPELSPPAPDHMTPASQSEQHRLGLTKLSPADRRRLDDLNHRYVAAFGFPFIVALHRLPDIASVYDAFETRLMADRATEMRTACREIISVSRARVMAAAGLVTS